MSDCTDKCVSESPADNVSALSESLAYSVPAQDQGAEPVEKKCSCKAKTADNTDKAAE